jgi:hypothetical protein
MEIVKLSVWIFDRHCSSFHRRNLIQNGRTERTEDLNISTAFCISFLNLSLALTWLTSKCLSSSVSRIRHSPSLFVHALFLYLSLTIFLSRFIIRKIISISLGFPSYCFVVASVLLPPHALLITLVSPPGSVGFAVFQCINGIATLPDI